MVERIGAYGVVQELGRGGMGVVYEGRAPNGQPVAIKVLLDSSRNGDAELRQRFETEIQACANLRPHPNVVRMLDAGQHQGMPFLVLELLEGEGLDELLRREGTLPIEATVRLVTDLVRGLEHVHAEGILHRDLKPSNVFMCPRRSVITDFGLARDAARERERLTMTGEMLGTVAYMAPEQANGEKDSLGPWTDVYALGAVLCKCLTGQTPFVGSQIQILRQVLDVEPTPPSRLRPEIDADLDALILRCLEKDPAQRFQTAVALGEALEDYLTARLATPARSPAWTLAVLIAGLAVGGGGVWLATRPRPTPVERVEVSPPDPLPTPVAVEEPPGSEAPSLAHALEGARARFAGRRRSEALRLLDEVPRSRWSPEAWLLRARILEVGAAITSSAEQKAGAREALEHLIEQDGQHLEARQRLALLLAAAPEGAALRSEAERAASRAGRETALHWVVKGSGAIQAGIASKPQQAALQKEALQHYERAIELDPTCREAWVGQISTLASVGTLPQIERHVRGMEERFPGGDAQQLLYVGFGLKNLRQVQRAIQVYTRAIVLEPEYHRAYLERGYAHGLTGKLDLAVADGRKSCELRPTSGHGWWILGLSLTARRDFAEAEAACTRAFSALLAEGIPVPSAYYAQRGKLRQHLGRLTEAQADFEAANGR